MKKAASMKDRGYRQDYHFSVIMHYVIKLKFTLHGEET
jgi:hypothetical protein